MIARVIYAPKNRSGGDGDDRNGMYLVRYTIAYYEGKPQSIVSEEDVARFFGDSPLDSVRLGLELSMSIMRGDAEFYPHDWKFDDLPQKDQ
jgi:hypothetical protein